MKKIIALLSAIALLSVFAFSACDFGMGRFYVSFDAQDGCPATTQGQWIRINETKLVIKPDDPVREGYTFEGWYKEPACKNKWDFDNDRLKSGDNITLYAKFTAIENPIDNPVVSSGFYRLQEAYDLGILTYADLHDIACYNNPDETCSSAISRLARPKNPEFLSEETENKIKQTFLDEFLDEIYVDSNGCILPNKPMREYTLDNISITNYCGTYNGAVVVMLDGLYGYDGGFTSETVAGITFYYNSGNYLRVWVENNDDPIPLSASFYGLQEAHNNGFITRDDLRHISYFMTGEVWEYTIDCDGGEKSTYQLDFVPEIDTPALADLDNKIVNDMKTVFYEINKQSMDDDVKWLKENGYMSQNITAIDTISMVSFFGIYNGFYAVRMTSSLWAYGDAEYSVNIAYNTGETGGAGITWYMSYSPILIFAYEKNPPFLVGIIENKMGSLHYDYAATILNSAFSCIAPSDILDGFGFHLDYDEEFFIGKALVVYIFNANTTGGILDVLQLTKHGRKLVMDIFFQAGYADALSYWTVVLEVNKADIAGIDEVEIKHIKMEPKKDRPAHPFDSARLEAFLQYWENVEPNDRPDQAWTVLKAVIDAANMVLDKGPVSQKQIDWITNFLKKAIDDLTSPYAVHGFAANPILCVVEDSYSNITFTADDFPEIDAEFIETLFSGKIIFIHLKTESMAYTLYVISLLQERQELSSAEVNGMDCLGSPWCGTCVDIGWWRRGESFICEYFDNLY